ncbi:hypothetical protein scyTo_0020446 [Scyliorhinus torazame]|uniref:Uncharacterized protein n=1 Tax=Scyliorhinus torazame TaxID=75743 RepID=A0A401PSR4_SCYTO|nr:hypothetical protein [Scyliorhinus torazame]
MELKAEVKSSEDVATDEVDRAGIDVATALKYSEAAEISQGNSTLGKGGPPGFSPVNGRTNTIVAVCFVAMVITLMAVSLYLTVTRKGCGRHNWKKQVDEESLS